MWRVLPQEGAPLNEVRIEGGAKDRDVVVVPREGESLRIPSAGDVSIQTVGLVTVRTGPIGDSSVRVAFWGDRLVLAKAEVAFDGSDREWDELWRRARTRSFPWWNEGGPELELDRTLEIRLVIAGVDR